ncbi:MAG: adenylate/guanylate cyclase domain-containing protein, partial [Actinomycetota bacterium]|nr:adenylate/guanylate cyclase domain-containing protein [Actinomycetota bacterium]
LLERATRLLEPDDPRRLVLLPDLAEALTATGDFQPALELLDEAIAAGAESGDERLQADAELVRLFVQGLATETGWSERLIPDAERAMAALERVDDHAGLAKGWRLIGSVRANACRYGDTALALEQAVAHARLAGDRRQELRSISAYAQALLLGPTPVADALAECERILERAGGDRRTEAFVLCQLSLLQARQGNFGGARASYVAARAIFEDLGFTLLANSVSLQSGRVELLAGDLRAAERELRRDYEALERMGEKYLRSTVAALLGQVVYAQGRLDEALALSNTTRELATEDDVGSQVLWRAIRAKALARGSLQSEALALADEAVELSRQTDAIELQASALVDLAEVRRIGGERDGDALAEALRLYELKGSSVAANQTRALLARGTGGQLTPA